VKTPDVPTGYIVALVGAIAAILTALGVPMSVEKQHAIEQAVEVIAPVMLLATGWLHTTRAKNVESILHAKALQAAAVAAAAAKAAQATAEVTAAAASPAG
jgi:sulfite exporter TauE/SafE